MPGDGALEQNFPNRSPQRVSAALAAAQAAAAIPARVEVNARGQSLADMAQRDLDAALQLLADRAQYITGASGAAIALRRDGRNDMLCRASSGANAPELGALLSTEFGLSGESVRTRRLLRCDDAERDARVNREVCRELGIASVLVMPVVNDDEVLGVFELFSGKSHAFGERDLSAVQRLSQMVQTAVQLAQATVALPEHLPAELPDGLKEQPTFAAEVADHGAQEGEFLSDLVVEAALGGPSVLDETTALETAGETKAEVAAVSSVTPTGQSLTDPNPSVAQNTTSPIAQQEALAAKTPEPVAPAPQVSAPKKPLFWSAAINADAEAAAKAAEPDQSRVPPILRALRKCEACGFPVSAGRVLCVECEEKKWRGQLRIPPRSMAKGGAAVPVPASAPIPAKAAHASTAAAPTMAKEPVAPAANSGAGSSASVSSTLPVSVSSAKTEKSPSEVVASETVSKPVAQEIAKELSSASATSSSPELVLSAAMEPSQSWLSSHKYVIGVLLLIACVAAAFYFLR
jgi:hypothetical protein